MNLHFIYRNPKVRFRDRHQQIKALLAYIQPGDTMNLPVLTSNISSPRLMRIRNSQ
jgi:hypothetical protein